MITNGRTNRQTSVMILKTQLPNTNFGQSMVCFMEIDISQVAATGRIPKASTKIVEIE